MKNSTAYLFWGLLALASGCGSPAEKTALIPPAQRVQAAEIQGFPLNSSVSPSLAKLRGKVIVLNFWATWCGPCQREFPSMVDLYQSYHDKGVEMIGLSVQLNENVPKDQFDQFLAHFKVPYPIALAGTQTLQAYQPTSIPMTFFIDKSGKIAATFVGLSPEKDFISALDQLVAEPGA